MAAVGRWRHDGSRVELFDIAAIRLVFSIAGGQELEWRRGDRTTKATARCGAVAIAAGWDSDVLEVRGRGDTLQILIDPLVLGGASPATASPRSPLEDALHLRALSAQALVALSGCSDRSIPRIVRTARALMSQSSSTSQPVARGGLSPGVLRRVQALVDGQLEREPDRLASVADLADLLKSQRIAFHSSVSGQRGSHAASVDHDAPSRKGDSSAAKRSDQRDRNRNLLRLFVGRTFRRKLPP